MSADTKSDDIDIETMKKEIKDGGKRKLILSAIFLTGFIGFVILVSYSPHLSM